MQLKMSQEELASRLGITFQQIQKYEKGVNRIGASRLHDLATFLGVTVQFFYDELIGIHTLFSSNAEESSSYGVIELIKTPEGFELNRAFVRIQDAATRHSLIALVKVLSALE